MLSNYCKLVKEYVCKRAHFRLTRPLQFRVYAGGVEQRSLYFCERLCLTFICAIHCLRKQFQRSDLIDRLSIGQLAPWQLVNQLEPITRVTSFRGAQKRATTVERETWTPRESARGTRVHHVHIPCSPPLPIQFVISTPIISL